MGLEHTYGGFYTFARVELVSEAINTGGKQLQDVESK